MFNRLLKSILKKERSEGVVNLILTNDRAIRKLNRIYRHRDKATDVLAFPMGEEGIIGDIAISKDTAKRNSRKFGISLKEELKRLTVHGVLHLLGYEHGRKMSNAEKIYQEL